MKSIGIDIGSENIKVTQLTLNNNVYTINNRFSVPHSKKPEYALRKIIEELNIQKSDYICTTGRYRNFAENFGIPEKLARTKGFRFLYPNFEEVAILSVSSHGYSLIEIFKDGRDLIHHNSNCTAETGNFISQLIDRLNISFEDINSLTQGYNSTQKLMGRCPVLLKTNLTHLANKGVDKVEILTALFDTIAESSLTLINPARTPSSIYLSGGVFKIQRIKEKVKSFLVENNMNLIDDINDHFIYTEAIGCAVYAMENKIKHSHAKSVQLETKNIGILPRLRDSLSRVKRINDSCYNISNGICNVILGLDVGSTGSKLVAYDIDKMALVYHDYVSTNGDPIHSTLKLIDNLHLQQSLNINVRGFGVTGSGREIAIALLTSSFGDGCVISGNELLAHAEGALYYNKDVDIIIEIGGQDSKFIRLSQGSVVEVALNESCSAGTGSFIEEQGKQFDKSPDANQLSLMAVESEYTVNLGRHCSVFMAEIMQQAIGLKYDRNAIIAGIYHSVVQNYLQRVVVDKPMGKNIYCQGMTFKSDALAAAFAMVLNRDITIPPNPGITGALGIAIIAFKRLKMKPAINYDIRELKYLSNFYKDSFECKSSTGCDKPGNKCEIEKLHFTLNGESKNIYWGGSCSLWSNTERPQSINPNNMPDIFKLREKYVADLVDKLKIYDDKKSVAISDGFQLKDLFPFFVSYINELGFNIVTENISDEDALAKGMHSTNVLYCAPMMIYSGVLNSFIERNIDYVFSPIMVDSPKIGSENYSKLCPIIQGSSNIIASGIQNESCKYLISPFIQIGKGNLESVEFIESCQEIAKLLNCEDLDWMSAYWKALKVQYQFDDYKQNIGRTALDFCKKQGVKPMVIIGKTYSIYNNILNSGIPKILRKLGAMPIPVDCFEVDSKTNDFDVFYWSCGQQSIRAAKRIRETEGIYAIFATNYSCGPDSFNQHFFRDVMNPKPYLIIDNDVRGSDNGIITRIEAFLECVSNSEHRANNSDLTYNKANYLPVSISIESIINDRTKLLIPYLGPTSDVFAAALRGSGIAAESLPIPDQSSIELGKKYTSGKECTPMISTLGSLLLYIEKNSLKDEKYVYFMPGSDGPCRFGMYNILQKIILDKIGLSEKIKILSSGNSNFVQDVPKGLFIILYIATCIIDSMNWCLHFTRPIEKINGSANDIFTKYKTKLMSHLENINSKNISTHQSLFQILSGQLFGCSEILKNAAIEFGAIQNNKELPTVSIDGALYIRCDSFSSDNLVEKLEKSGIRALPAQFFDWLEFLDSYEDKIGSSSIKSTFNQFLKYRIKETCNSIISKHSHCPKIPHLDAAIKSTKQYIDIKLMSESMLSVGKSMVLKRNRQIDSIVLVSPHECMQSKITESLLKEIYIKEGLHSNALQFNNDNIDSNKFDNLVFEIIENHRNS